MGLQHPIAVYTAASNLEAHLICEMLMGEGIEAAVVEDESRAGAWMFGLMPQIHKPQVWVEESAADQARQLLAAYERRLAEQSNVAESAPPVWIVCEECRRSTSFPASRLGHVETCSHCGAYVDVDVGIDSETDDWNTTPGDEADV